MGWRTAGRAAPGDDAVPRAAPRQSHADQAPQGAVQAAVKRAGPRWAAPEPQGLGDRRREPRQSIAMSTTEHAVRPPPSLPLALSWCLPGQTSRPRGRTTSRACTWPTTPSAATSPTSPPPPGAPPVSDGATWTASRGAGSGSRTDLHHHHTVEDTTLWPQLLEPVDAAGDTAARETLEAMEAERRLIDPLLTACARGFAAMAHAPTAGTAERLAGAAAAARDTLAAHLRHEETEALPCCSAHLSAEGWQRVEDGRRRGHRRPRTCPFVPWGAKGLDPRGARPAVRPLRGKPMRVLLSLFRGRFGAASGSPSGTCDDPHAWPRPPRKASVTPTATRLVCRPREDGEGDVALRPRQLVAHEPAVRLRRGRMPNSAVPVLP